jgi:hypothetical protein
MRLNVTCILQHRDFVEDEMQCARVIVRALGADASPQSGLETCGSKVDSVSQDGTIVTTMLPLVALGITPEEHVSHDFGKLSISQRFCMCSNP